MANTVLCDIFFSSFSILENFFFSEVDTCKYYIIMMTDSAYTILDGLHFKHHKHSFFGHICNHYIIMMTDYANTVLDGLHSTHERHSSFRLIWLIKQRTCICVCRSHELGAGLYYIIAKNCTGQYVCEGRSYGCCFSAFI